MIDRRNFIKKTAFAGIAFGISNPLLSSATNKVNNSSNILRSNYTGFRWDKTIFCQFDNHELQKRVEKCAKEIDCKVYYGEPDSPDIIAVPYFVSIVDRDIVGRKWWVEYIEHCFCVDDKTPCIMVNRDNFDAMCEFPAGNYVYAYYSPKTNRILNMIKKIKKEIDSNG